MGKKLSKLFNGREDATLIFRGDWSTGGFMGSAYFKKGSRFELMFKKASYCFIADEVTVKPVCEITQAELAAHVNGHGVANLVEGRYDDDVPLDDNEPVTVINFRKETAYAVPRCWIDQRGPL